MKVALTVCEGKPEEGESSGGDRAASGLTRRVLRRTGKRSKALKASAWPWSYWETESRGNGRTTRGQRRATSPCGFLPGKTPGERTLDVVAG
jgi:hypothetical protein